MGLQTAMHISVSDVFSLYQRFAQKRPRRLLLPSSDYPSEENAAMISYIFLDTADLTMKTFASCMLHCTSRRSEMS